jgi:hypothetical protein
MDPAESDKVRQALSSQGTRIGQHDAALQEFSEVLRGFSVGMTELGARMEQIGSQVSSLAAPGSIHGPAVSSASDFHAAAHVASPSQLREPFIPTPVRYSGELGRCRQFLHQCTLVFEQQPLSYASDRTKTAFMMSLLSDQAADWAVANSINRPSLALSYADFVNEMRRVFDHPVRGKEASSRLLSLRQGSDSVAQFALSFRILAAESGWDETALQSVFLRGLTDRVRDELAVRDETNSLDELIALASRLDNRLRERQRERRNHPDTPSAALGSGSTGWPVARSNPMSRSAPNASSTDVGLGPEPMQVGRMRLPSAERRRRTRNNLCLYCGEGGHSLDACPQTVKGQAHQLPGGRW